jgi:TolB-like protein
MASIIKGYEYDIFISYRQKDNKYDGWVTEFVNNLKGELEATFKETVSVYFDENPHDRLQETHHVAKSLEAKLKCVIFIPILSQTYCDPNCYAWQFELVVFNKMAAEDQFGKEVKLRGGNFASRILPIRIHDLEPEDIELFQQETGSVLRAMDFVFKTASGVNRPLRAHEDHPNDNLNKTFYRDQVNKVAHAIKEIIIGMKAAGDIVSVEKQQPGALSESGSKLEKFAKAIKPIRTGRKNLIPALVIALAIILTGVFIYEKLFKQNRLEILQASGDRITVAVMPFQNMTTDYTWDVWQDGIQDILITSLSNSRELVVRQVESVNRLIQSNGVSNNYASLTPSVASNISKKLDADVFVCGNMKKAGPVLRVYAQLIDSKTRVVYQSFQIEGQFNEEVIFFLADSLAILVRDYLVVTELKKELPSHSRQLVSTNSPEAFRYFILGRNEFFKREWEAARNLFFKALALDSNFVYAINMISLSYGNEANWDQAKKWSLMAYEKRDQMPLVQKINTNRIYSSYHETPHETIRYLKQLLDFDNQDPVALYCLGLEYNKLQQYDKTIPVLEECFKITKKRGLKPDWANDYLALGRAYHNTGQYKKERKLYKEAIKHFPDDPFLLRSQWILSVVLGQTEEFNRLDEKARSYLKKLIIA